MNQVNDNTNKINEIRFFQELRENAFPYNTYKKYIESEIAQILKYIKGLGLFSKAFYVLIPWYSILYPHEFFYYYYLPDRRRTSKTEIFLFKLYKEWVLNQLQDQKIYRLTEIILHYSQKPIVEIKICPNSNDYSELTEISEIILARRVGLPILTVSVPAEYDKLSDFSNIKPPESFKIVGIDFNEYMEGQADEKLKQAMGSFDKAMAVFFEKAGIKESMEVNWENKSKINMILKMFLSLAYLAPHKKEKYYIYIIPTDYNVEAVTTGIILYANEDLEEDELNMLKLVSSGIFARSLLFESSLVSQSHALRSAVAAIMARNMSHNIGSHVLNYLSNPEELDNLWVN